MVQFGVLAVSSQQDQDPVQIEYVERQVDVPTPNGTKKVIKHVPQKVEKPKEQPVERKNLEDRKGELKTKFNENFPQHKKENTTNLEKIKRQGEFNKKAKGLSERAKNFNKIATENEKARAEQARMEAEVQRNERLQQRDLDRDR